MTTIGNDKINKPYEDIAGSKRLCSLNVTEYFQFYWCS